MTADHSHECRNCGWPWYGCSVDDETCLSKGSPNFDGLCDSCARVYDATDHDYEAQPLR